MLTGSFLFVSISGLLMALFPFHNADMETYTKNVVYVPTETTDLSFNPEIRCKIATSNLYMAGTEDVVYISFIGAFADSGPHAICDPCEGGTGGGQWVYIELDRHIGELTSMYLQKDGEDGWILSGLTCDLKGLRYLTSPLQIMWLDNFSKNVSDLNNGNGFEPETQLELYVHPTMEIPVTSVSQLYSATGIMKS